MVHELFSAIGGETKISAAEEHDRIRLGSLIHPVSLPIKPLPRTGCPSRCPTISVYRSSCLEYNSFNISLNAQSPLLGIEFTQLATKSNTFLFSGICSRARATVFGS